MANYHVTKPKGSDVWKVVKTKRNVPLRPHLRKKEAEKIAKDLAGNSGGGEVRIHKPDGGPIRDSDTVAPGNDPNPPKDTKH